MNTYNEKEIIEEYINTYKSNFPIINGNKDYCIDLIRDSYKNNRKNELLDEVFYATGLFNDNENPYLGFAKFIENKFGLNLNILEIGGGVFPALSDAISTKQIKIGKGTITVYDPLLSVNKLKNIKLVKEEFNYRTNIKDYDLIIGIKPCNGTETLIEKSQESNKNFMIYPCDCTHHLEFDEFDSFTTTEWYNYIYDLCKKNNRNINIDYLPKIYKYPNPIYSYKK